jgi:hypothetical protein
MHIPALAELHLDPALVGLPTRVYLLLLNELDPVEFRPVKAWAVAQALPTARGRHVRPQSVGRALKLLVKAGLLIAGPADHGGIRQYKIVYRRPRAGGMAPDRHAGAA